jgi:coenzyme PQQ precursor peptide PqqA
MTGWARRHPAGVFCSRTGGLIMRQWHTPQVVEIALGLEINCYMCAEL